ncbi:MAG: hypothetical protein K2Y37_11135 [Pirellulales bacterium]|nr:hypothetical protein [Pirellulales bacterium]
MLHAFELWGPSAKFPETVVSAHGMRLLSGTEVKQVLLDHRVYRQAVGSNCPLLIPTRYGVRVEIGLGTASSFAGATGHSDDLLRACAAHGMATDASLVTPLGAATIADLLNDSIATFDPAQELEWTVEAFARYLAPQRSWENRFGESYDFDLCMRSLLSRPLGTGACLGTHALYAFAVLLRIDEKAPILSSTVRSRVRVRLRDAAGCLARNQRADGAWTKDWPVRVPAASSGLDWEALTATGHHLEWIALLSDDLRPPKASLRKAVCFLVASTNGLSSHEETDYYLPIAHAARALCLMRNTSPEALLGG